MPEMHLKQPGFNYIACGPFTKNKERIQKLIETGDTKYIYRNELDRACFQHDMACGDFKDLEGRTGPDKVLRVKAFNITKNPKYDGYQRSLASMVYKFLIKKPQVVVLIMKLNKMNNQIEQLHKPIIKKFKKRKIYSSFKDNIWGADLAHMQLISRFNKGIGLLLCVIDIFCKYAWIVPLKDKKGITIVNAFQSILNSSKRKPNKVWVDKDSEFYNRSIKS